MYGSLPRRQVFRIVAAAAVATTVSLGTVACGGSAGQASDELVYWSMWKAGEPQAKVLESAIASFTKETGVKVKVEWKGRDVSKQLAPTLNTRNVPADLMDSADRFVKSTFVATGQGLDLSPVYDMEIPGEAGKKVGDVIDPKYRDYATADGKPWLVPYEVLAEQIWYNGDELKDVASAPPKTWDDFVTLLGERKSARNDGPLALDADIADYSAFWTYHAVLRDLGPGAFGAAAVDKTGAKFDDPAFLAAIQKIEKLVKDGYFAKGYDGSKYPAIQQKWAGGGADFLLLGTFAPSETKPSAKEGFAYRSFPFPEGAKGEQTQEISLIGFAIPAQAGNAEAAKKFVAYFMNKERLSKIASEAGNITPRPDIEVPAELADVKKTLDTAETHPALDGVKMDNADWYTKVFQPVNTELITGKASAADFVAKLKSTSVDFWKLND
ncbi:raffinose/stachyose/melibiose transport system substrate-binding protein [Streptosporangium album]|uniref:Raffinose/stachyose/melibiose transport system substrate-binding protein n=1 Tax=Streptosporangium album TaxID=47479 RepID=A0A7W7S2G2_9ACTN|nr:extracellular solute-binding protein [Streptosporangium album]MBB4942560.1 raffinose/stachyose/melibiose transport system substrate-binding protein [Streptosporangium album]